MEWPPPSTGSYPALIWRCDGNRSSVVGTPDGVGPYGRRMLGAHMSSSGAIQEVMGAEAASQSSTASSGDYVLVWWRTSRCMDKSLGYIQPGWQPQEMVKVGTCLLAAQELLGYFLKDVHYDEDCIWQEKGVQENSDTEAKNLNKWDLNNRFSWKSPEDGFFIHTSGAVSLEEDNKMLFRQKRLSFCFNWKIVCGIDIPREMLR